MSEMRSAFGRTVRAHRVNRTPPMAQRELAQAANVARSTLSRIETGLHNPSLSVQLRIAAALGVPLSDLIAQAERPAPRRVADSRPGDDER